MRKILGIILPVIFLLTGCSASLKSADMVENCKADAAMEVVEEAAAYSMERSVDGGAGFSVDTPMISAIFTQYTDSLIAETGAKLFTAQCYAPEFKTNNTELDQWLADRVIEAAEKTMEDINWTRRTAETDYANGDEGTFYGYSYYTNVSVERLDNSVISVLQVNSVYSGGAHPNYAQLAYNLDLEACRQLELADVLEPEGEEALLERILEDLESRFSGIEGLGLYPEYRQIIEDQFKSQELTNNWYFSNNALVIYFNCYEIAPYAAGIIKVECPYETLDGVLRADYFPSQREAGEGSAVLLNAPDDRETINVVSDGVLFYISAEHVIYDVTIHRISSWLSDDVPIVGPMVFAANRLTCLEAVEIGDNNLPNEAMYLISYCDEAGNRYKVAIGPEIMRKIAE